MNLADKNEVRRLLDSQGFSFKKSLGQNFIIDSSVCPRMADAACDGETGVIEVGPGAGVLTAALAERAKKVVSVELDERLRPILQKTLSGYDNVEIVFGDIMKTDVAALIKERLSDCKRVCVCANLPYYITSPVIMHLLESHLPVDDIVVMVQKEAAERLCAEVGSRAAGAVTVAVRYYAEAQLLFEIPRDSFLPAPKVDSAVIRLSLLKSGAVAVSDEHTFFRFVRACFAQRRKTLLNTVSSTMGIEKGVLSGLLVECGIDPAVRGETLSMEQMAEISEKIFALKN